MHKCSIVIAVSLSVVLALAACGGGGGQPVTMEPEPPTTTPEPEPEPEPEPHVDNLPFPLEPWVGRLYDPVANVTYTAAAFPNGSVHYGVDDLPAIGEADVSRAPVYHDAPLRGWVPRGDLTRRIFVGIDQGSTALAGLPVVGTRGTTEIRYGRLEDGASREIVLGYLRTAGLSPSGDTGPLLRWDRAPTVSYGGAVTPADYERLLRAVQLVNAALPPEYRMTVDPAGRATRSDSDIFVEFDRQFFIDNAWGQAINNFDGATITSSHIRISKNPANPYDGISDRQATILISHELLHALGLYGDHIGGKVFTGSILTGTRSDYSSWAWGERQPVSLLWPADREALRVLYGELTEGEGIADFGPWSDSSLHVHGNAEHAGFGVALRNGYAEPWAYGYLPDTDLANNRALSGTVEWIGTMLGFTPEALVVTGDAQIAVDLGTLAGATTFTTLEEWTGAPGQPGDGTVWGRGELGYAIMVEGNTFRRTAGDEGVLTGIFTGAAHEGAAGTLERSDLTAAFGASR